MKWGILTMLAVFLLSFGCLGQAPATGAAGQANPQAGYTFSTITNNTTSTAYLLGQVLTTHAYTYAFSGNWTDRYANVTLQGSEDNATWATLGSASGNTNGTSFVTGSPIVYARVVVTGWNATAGNSSVNSLKVSYIGSKS